MDKEVEDLSVTVYIIAAISFFGIIVLIIETVFLHWKVHKLSRSNGHNGPREADNSKELGLQLVKDRFHIPKPNLKKPWDRFEANNVPANNFEYENRSFNQDPEDRRPNAAGMQDSGLRSQFPGHNDIDTISDSNFSFSRPSNNVRDEPRSKRKPEDRKLTARMPENDSGFPFSGQNDDYFPLPCHGGAQNDLRNKREPPERRPFGNNVRSTNSFRNPLSSPKDYDAMSDNVPHSQQRNLQRSVNY